MWSVNLQVVIRVFHPLFKPASGQIITVFKSSTAGQGDCIHLIVPAQGHEKIRESGEYSHLLSSQLKQDQPNQTESLQQN